jgi:SHS2 domain-containing protein
MPFKEIQHTADWCLRVWAVDLPTLFVEAARGMNTLSGMQPTLGPVTHQTFESSAQDTEILLVSFLSELVYAAEQEHKTFISFQVDMFESSDGWFLRVEMDSSPIKSLNKLIKAVTFHNLHIRQVERGVEVEIVFDV